MPPARALWRPRATTSVPRPLLRPRPSRPRVSRPYSNNPQQPPPNSSPSPNTPPSTAPPSPSATESRTTHGTSHRLTTLLSRTLHYLPPRLRNRLHPHITALRAAPLSHATAFLVLHEVTAVVPVLGLAWAFHRLDWAPPVGWLVGGGPWAGWAEEGGVRRWGAFFRRKGWFGLGGDGEEALEGELEGEIERRERDEKEGGKRGAWSWLSRWRRDTDADTGAAEEAKVADEGESKKATAWQKVKKVVTVDNTEKGYKIGIQIAAAYTITKMLLVPRLALSLWATPWLARGFVAMRRSIWKKRT
ncbi:hypothetical protein F5B20DRAFT_558854 [Whalleya microplaca]|nr:hypothetical protein F5B20DRAFT_558854 [Whalleya microplaca]